MNRMYLLLPSLEATKRIVSELLAERIPEKNLHIIGNADIDLEDLPEASVLQNSDLLPALQRGVAIGGTSGLLAGLAAVAFPPAGVVLAGGAVALASAIVGAGMGAWASSLIGISTPHPDIQRFENAIQKGNILLLVDADNENVDRVKEIIYKAHPTIKIYGTMPELISI